MYFNACTAPQVSAEALQEVLSVPSILEIGPRGGLGVRQVG